jgi:hypothetical protein
VDLRQCSRRLDTLYEALEFPYHLKKQETVVVTTQKYILNLDDGALGQMKEET